MNEKVLTTLEFHKIRNQLVEKASSKMGQEKCQTLEPVTDITMIEQMQQQTSDALTRLFRSGTISFCGSRSILGALKRLDKGSTISPAELLEIAALLENAARVKAYGRGDQSEETLDSLTPLFDALSPLTPVSARIRLCLLSEDEVSDDASPKLHSIRRHMKSTNDKIHSQLTSMVNTTYRTYLQDTVITMRDNRYCIPVKAEYKANVPGMVHDQSASASTYFIEPAAIVNLNNELRQLEIEEAKEIEVIIASLSAECADNSELIKIDVEMLSELDFIFAKGQLALEMNATRPLYEKEGIIKLRKARHPLLHKKSVVPIDIELGERFDLLIITGPNTGGKTVALKTMGLLCIMGQSGLHIPALDRSQLSVFHEIFADIGDEQSIEQSLSTFSSHMRSIVHILEAANEHSLCLFDELGAGTDPTEGAALAISILNDLHQRGIRTIATTHYSELKIYALREPYVENACCEFDVETLRPTYRLLIGVPGKSNAFAISSKLGLPEYIIEDARSRIDKKDESFEDVITKLEENRRILEQEKLEAEHYKKEIQQLKQEFETKQNKLNASREKILSEAREEARELLKDAKDTADEAIRNFQKTGKAAPDIRQMEKDRAKLRKKLDQTQANGIAPAKQAKREHKPSDFKLGESVVILSTNMKGTVSSLPDAKGNLFVQCGILRMQANMKDIDFIEANEQTSGFSSKGKKSGKMSLSKASSISSEINLLGNTVDEAIAKLDKYLDDAYLSHLSSVRIVHGKGTGALRQAVANHLRKISYVKSYKLAEYGEGDAGVTIVEFK